MLQKQTFQNLRKCTKRVLRNLRWQNNVFIWQHCLPKLLSFSQCFCYNFLFTKNYCFKLQKMLTQNYIYLNIILKKRTFKEPLTTKQMKKIFCWSLILRIKRIYFFMNFFKITGFFQSNQIFDKVFSPQRFIFLKQQEIYNQNNSLCYKYRTGQIYFYTPNQTPKKTGTQNQTQCGRLFEKQLETKIFVLYYLNRACRFKFYYNFIKSFCNEAFAV